MKKSVLILYMFYLLLNFDFLSAMDKALVIKQPRKTDQQNSQNKYGNFDQEFLRKFFFESNTIFVMTKTDDEINIFSIFFKPTTSI